MLYTIINSRCQTEHKFGNSYLYSYDHIGQVISVFQSWIAWTDVIVNNHQKSPNMFPKKCRARVSSFPFLGRLLPLPVLTDATALAEGKSSTNTVVSPLSPFTSSLSLVVVEHVPPLKWVQPVSSTANTLHQSPWNILTHLDGSRWGCPWRAMS